MAIGSEQPEDRSNATFGFLAANKDGSEFAGASSAHPRLIIMCSPLPDPEHPVPGDGDQFQCHRDTAQEVKLGSDRALQLRRQEQGIG